LHFKPNASPNISNKDITAVASTPEVLRNMITSSA
jgi:hypothetical protein